MGAKADGRRYCAQVWHTSVAKIVNERLKIEGLWDEFSAKVKAAVANGVPSRRAAGIIRKEYQRSETEERDWYNEHLKRIKKEETNKKNSAKQLVNRQLRKELNFTEALDMLKNQSKATYDQDMEWIYSHPAMQRKSVAVDKTAHIIITPEDILYPGHGEAPSRGAAIMLQQHVNDPAGFYDLYGKYIKGRKQADTSGVPGGAEYSDEMGIADCRKLHKIALGLEAE